MSVTPTYLVIGGSGFLGAFVTRELVRLGHRPIVLVRTGRTDLIGDVVDRICLVMGDASNGEQMADLVRKHRVTHIAHLYGTIAAVEEAAGEAAFVSSATRGFVNVLEAARLNDVRRVVMASSKAVYGDLRRHGTALISEQLAPEPQGRYAHAKLAMEHIGAAYGDHGIAVLSLRFGTTVGPGKIQRYPTRANHLGVMIESALAHRPVRIEAGGDAVIDRIYAADVARGFACALAAPDPAHRVFNIGMGTGSSLAQLADIVRAAVPGAEIEVGPGIEDGDAATHGVLDIGRATAELGYVPQCETPQDLVDCYIEDVLRLGAHAIR